MTGKGSAFQWFRASHLSELTELVTGNSAHFSITILVPWYTAISSLHPFFAAYYYGKKKKKIGRPPGGHSNVENASRRPGRRRKKRRFGLIIHRKRPSVDSEETNNSEVRERDICDNDSTASTERRDIEQDFRSMEPRRKRRRRYQHHIPPPTTIKTRGATGLKYTFEKRTHQKVPLPPHDKSPKKRKMDSAVEVV